MSRTRLSQILIGVIVAVGLASGTTMIVRLAPTCHPDPDAPAIIERYRTDPFLSGAPTDGQLTAVSVRADTCVTWQGEDGREPISVSHLYQVPIPNTSMRLHQRYDPLAAANGWTFLHEDPNTDYTHAALTFTNTIGGRKTLVVIGSLPAGLYRYPDRHTVYVTAVDNGL